MLDKNYNVSFHPTGDFYNLIGDDCTYVDCGPANKYYEHLYLSGQNGDLSVTIKDNDSDPSNIPSGQVKIECVFNYSVEHDYDSYGNPIVVSGTVRASGTCPASFFDIEDDIDYGSEYCYLTCTNEDSAYYNTQVFEVYCSSKNSRLPVKILPKTIDDAYTRLYPKEIGVYKNNNGEYVLYYGTNNGNVKLHADESISTKLATGLLNHTGSKSNPHSVTCAQIGAVTKTQMDNSIKEAIDNMQTAYVKTAIEAAFSETESELSTI